ncbi:NAD(P)-dependent oxidoreductase [Agromyces sp. PvR057]|uniref:NAD-dependent epimerase/dehydratase family protein n=1 Tax=Agromyces sp. PvR057 TaxID=3156403 RepID=UPI000E22DD39
MPEGRVLVTGAGGYVGRHVVTALLDLGYLVTATVRPGSRADVDSRADVVAIDLLDPATDVTTIAEQAPDAVVHLAWQDGFKHNAPSHMLMLSRHVELLEALTAWGVPRISVLGTMHEIGYWEGAITADTPTNPTSLYGIAKDALRRASFVSLADRTSLRWLRCYYILGDDRNNNSIFTRILEAVDAGKETFPFTTGKNRYDFIDVSDLGRQIAVAAVQDEVSGIINCASGEPKSLAQAVESFIADRNLPITLEYGAFPDRPYDSPGVWGDATEILGLMDRA